jgi:starch synthase (maltosyl-transferring)
MQEFFNLRFLGCADPNILAYTKISADRTNVVIIVVNLDPHGAHDGMIELPLGELGLPADAEFVLEEAFTHRAVNCRGAHQRFQLDPEVNPALIFRLLTAP